jgi:phospholipid/cholesterol/gamma-HCH transport system substrate-binding protein
MEAEARYTYVGAAVLALVAALIAAAVWLQRTGAERDYTRYTIYFEEQALDGLSVGADVNMRGISVGRVLDYQLSTDRLNQARVDVRIDRRAPVRENTVAAITRNFVTGIAQVRLVTSEPAGPPLTRVPEGERYPVIAEGRSDLTEIAGRVTELGQMAGIALNNLNLLLTEDNRRAIAQAAANLRDLSADLRQQLAGLDGTLAEMTGAAREFRRTAAQLADTGERVGSATTATLDEARVLIADLRGVAADAQRAVGEATRAVGALQSDAAGAARRLDATASLLDDQVLVAVGELRGSLDALQRTLDRLSDPRGALFGPERSRLGPGEKVR